MRFLHSWAERCSSSSILKFDSLFDCEKKNRLTSLFKNWESTDESQILGADDGAPFHTCTMTFGKGSVTFDSRVSWISSEIYWRNFHQVNSHVQPIADRVAQHLEIISKKFRFSTRHTRILMGFIIYYLVLIVYPMGRILVLWKKFRNNLEILCHPICNRLYQDSFMKYTHTWHVELGADEGSNIHINIHTRIHTSIHTCPYTKIHTYILTYIQTYIYTLGADENAPLVRKRKDLPRGKAATKPLELAEYVTRELLHVKEQRELVCNRKVKLLSKKIAHCNTHCNTHCQIRAARTAPCQRAS